MAVAMGEPLPGLRVLVSYRDDPGWHHERVLGWPVVDGRWVVKTADGDVYDEVFADWASVARLTGENAYPRGVGQVVAFAAWTQKETLDFLQEARLEAKRVRRDEALGGPVEPTRLLTWGGRALLVPAERLGDGVRMRLYGKQSAPRPRGTGVAERVAEVELPLQVSEELTPPTPAGHVWLVSELDAACGLALGAETELSAGTVVRGGRALVKDVNGFFYSAELVGEEDVQRWKEKRLLAAEPVADERAGGDASLGELQRRLYGADEPAAGGAATPGRAEVMEADLRTLFVDYDEQGCRFKSWRVAVNESSEERFGDSPI